MENDNKKEQTKIIITKGDKSYLNICCFELNVGIAFTYLYVITSSAINIINRIIFHNYEFRFNFTYSFLQQFASLLIFIIFKNSESIKKNIGELSLSEFLKFKWYYLSFTLIFILNTLIGFYGNQLVHNIAMFLSLKKFTLIFFLIIDIFYAKKKISLITVFCVFLMTGGSFLVGMEAFSNDYFGYIIVFLSNAIQVVYSKLIELFKQHTGVSSLKLLIFNTILSIPLLFLGGIITNEHKKIYIYLNNNYENDGKIYGLGIYLIMGCLCCIILLSSFFISNEKSSSLITNLLTNTKSVFISIIMHFLDKSKNKIFQRLAKISMRKRKKVNMEEESRKLYFK